MRPVKVRYLCVDCWGLTWAGLVDVGICPDCGGALGLCDQPLGGSVEFEADLATFADSVPGSEWPRRETGAGFPEEGASNTFRFGSI